MQAELRVVREVRAEFQEERAEVAVDTIHVEVIHHRCRPHQPRIGSPGRLARPPLRTEHRRPLLSLPDEQHPFVLCKFAQMLGRHVVLALALAKLHHWNLFLLRESFQGRDKALTDRVHQGARDERVAAMIPKEAGHAHLPLPLWHVDVQIHPVDPFDLQVDVISQYFSDTSCYAHFGSGTTPIPRDRLPLRRPKSWARTVLSSPLSIGAIFGLCDTPRT